MNEQTEMDLNGAEVIPEVTPSLAETWTALLGEMEERKEHIENALKHCRGSHTYDDIVYMVMSNTLKWWCLPNSFMVTEIGTYPRCKMLHVFLAGGNLEEILATQDDLIAHAQENDCSKVTLSGRYGWKKPLFAQGWEKPSMSIALEVPDGR